MTASPTPAPTPSPTPAPTAAPTSMPPTTRAPTRAPTRRPTRAPTRRPPIPFSGPGQVFVQACVNRNNDGVTVVLERAIARQVGWNGSISGTANFPAFMTTNNTYPRFAVVVSVQNQNLNAQVTDLDGPGGTANFPIAPGNGGTCGTPNAGSIILV